MHLFFQYELNLWFAIDYVSESLLAEKLSAHKSSLTVITQHIIELRFLTLELSCAID